MSFSQYVVLKKGPCPYVCSRCIKKGPLYFTHATQKFHLLKAIEIFHFVWKFASAWKSISHYKWFEVIWFYTNIYPCSRLHTKERTGFIL